MTPWQRVCHRLAAIDSEDVNDATDPRSPIELIPPERGTAWLYAPKFRTLLQRVSLDSISTGILGRYGSIRGFEAIVSAVIPRGATLHVLADIDPLDLALFLALADALPDRDIRWALGDEALAAVERDAAIPSWMCISLNAEERAAWEILRPEVQETIGARATALLDGGSKLEVDALYHHSLPALFAHVGLTGARLNPPGDERAT